MKSRLSIVAALFAIAAGGLRAQDATSGPAPASAPAVAEPPAVPPPSIDPAPCAGCSIPFRGNLARTGEFPGPDLEREPKVAWKYGRTDRTPVLVEAAIAGDRGYLVTPNGHLQAVSLAGGDKLWMHKTGHRSVVPLPFVILMSHMLPSRATPLAADGRVYFGYLDGTMKAIDAADGSVRWNLETRGAIENAPTRWGDSLYFNNDAGELYKVDPADGKTRWILRNPASAKAKLLDKDLPFTNASFTAPPTFAEGVIYIPSCEWRVYAVDPDSGAERWHFTADGSVPEAVAAAAGALYFTSVRRNRKDDKLEGTLYALDARGGAVLWSKPRRGDAVAPAVGGDWLYVPDGAGQLLAIDRRTGETRWSAKLRGAAASPPTLGPRLVYIADEKGTLHAFERETGREAWSLDKSFTENNGPVLADGTLYLTTRSGAHIALRK